MSNTNVLCPCGQCHPVGYICEKAKFILSPYKKAEKPEHEPQEHGSCGCSHETQVEEVNFELLGEASDTKAMYRIMNMDCPMEEALIRKKLGGMAGINSLEFNLMQRVLTVHHNLGDTKGIEEALKAIDMIPEVLGLNRESTGLSEIPEIKSQWKRLIFAGIFAVFSEFFELYFEWQNVEISNVIYGNLPFIFAMIAILLGGFTTYKKGWIAVKNFNLNINALMAVAVTGAVFIGQYPEAAMVMVLFNIAEAIEAKSLDKARNAIKNLLNLTPEKVTILLADNTWAEENIKEVALGTRVRVKPGERVGLDGIIVEGQSAVNQASITGESLPVEKTIGDLVYAGTINEYGSFQFEVTALASNSTLARIIHAVEEAQGTRAPMQRFVDEFAKYYTPLVFLTAILVALIPPLFMDWLWADSIYTALVLLVIGCPCALVISTPVSIVSGMAAGTKQGLLIKGGVFLEQGRLLKWLALDKTGTITHGKPAQTDFVSLGELNSDTVQILAASLALRSDHPVSKAIAENAVKEKIDFEEVQDFQALLGQGTMGKIQGKQWYLGNIRLIEKLGKLSFTLEEQILHFEKSGKTVVALIGEKQVEGLFAVADTLKESSIEAIKELKALGIKTMMLTGDNEHTAKVIAEQVGVDSFKANLLPEDKLAIIEELEKMGKTGMVGDGINDSPALAKAHIGFAMAAAGTDTAIETADVALMDDDLRKIPRFIKLSKATYAILVQNISLALGIKALFLVLTFMGFATMWMAVFADVGTSLLVVANGLRAMNK